MNNNQWSIKNDKLTCSRLPYLLYEVNCCHSPYENGINELAKKNVFQNQIKSNSFPLQINTPDRHQEIQEIDH